jgi:hypothetical protein
MLFYQFRRKEHKQYSADAVGFMPKKDTASLRIPCRIKSA